MQLLIQSYVRLFVLFIPDSEHSPLAETYSLGPITLPVYDDCRRQLDVLKKRHGELLCKIQCETLMISRGTERPLIVALAWEKKRMETLKQAIVNNLKAQEMTEEHSMLEENARPGSQHHPALTIHLAHQSDLRHATRYLNCNDMSNAVLMVFEDTVDSATSVKWFQLSTGTVCIGSFNEMKANMETALERHILFGIRANLKVLQHMTNLRNYDIDAPTSKLPDKVDVHEYLHYVYVHHQFLAPLEQSRITESGTAIWLFYE